MLEEVHSSLQTLVLCFEYCFSGIFYISAVESEKYSLFRTPKT